MLAYFVLAKTSKTFQQFKQDLHRWLETGSAVMQENVCFPQTKAGQINLWIFNQATPIHLCFPVKPLQPLLACLTMLLTSLVPFLLLHCVLKWKHMAAASEQLHAYTDYCFSIHRSKAPPAACEETGGHPPIVGVCACQAFICLHGGSRLHKMLHTRVVQAL